MVIDEQTFQSRSLVLDNHHFQETLSQIAPDPSIHKLSPLDSNSTTSL